MNLVSDQLAKLAPRFRNLVALKHELMTEVAALLERGWTLEAAGTALAEGPYADRTYTGLDGDTTTYHVFKVSGHSIRRWWAAWSKNRTPLAFQPGYKTPKAKLPPKTVADLLGRRTLSGIATDSAAIESLKKDWRNGNAIPGLGTWQEWWAENYEELPLPARAPEFPFSDSTFYRHLKNRDALKTQGSKGKFEAKLVQPFTHRNYSTLRPFELFTADDVRLDIVAIDLDTGKATTVSIYLMMEVSCRFITAFVLRPANALNSGDVKAMLARGLAGIGVDYPTHVLLERGTVSLSADDQQVIEAQSSGHIKIHQTSMVRGARHPGAFRDRAAGNFMGKAVIESFMRKLQSAVMDLPGQRGNRYDNQPAALGFNGDGKPGTPGSVVREAEDLAALQAKVNALFENPKLRVTLDLPLLTTHQLNAAIREAIKAHNDSPDHDYKDFGYAVERQTAPGVWEQIGIELHERL